MSLSEQISIPKDYRVLFTNIRAEIDMEMVVNALMLITNDVS
jgi:hypothetical protein